jgi:2-polyprenyl-6-hydroxyphenyl methylase/3-demethylubiquinone-9 3-methyltransferase
MQHANNVDLGEIAKFEALANRWWDPDSEFKPLHDINPLRLNYIDERAGLAGRRVVDIGCGGGLLAEGDGSARRRGTGHRHGRGATGGGRAASARIAAGGVELPPGDRRGAGGGAAGRL